MPVSEYSMDANRTTDVQTHGDTTFQTIVTGHPEILKGLTDCGFVKASPIQVAALPTIIAGNDTIVEAKNGTGKTLTFVIPTLMRLKASQKHLHSVILAPTREIAVQIQQCFKKVGQHLPDLKCEYFIGGTPIDEDKQKAKGCQIAVGSPGRIKHLLNEHVLKGSEVKSFILDEVDRLFTDKNFTKDIRLIDAKFPKVKQMIAVSASIDKNNMSLFDEFMKEYTVVQGAEEDMNASQDPSKFLLGIAQYVACVKAVSTNIILLPAKNVRLLNILQNLSYTQCIVFTNYMTRVEAVCNMLRDHHYKADYIRGDQDQKIRLKLVDRLTSFKSKILVATDLIARGIDSSNVDLVINMDCPHDWATYLHRIGRAGRFGNKGNAFTILDDDKELKSFKHIINSIENVKIKILPIVIEKPILEYTDSELEDLNLTTETINILTENQTGESTIEENEKKDNTKDDCKIELSDLESNISNSTVEPGPGNMIKSIYEPGISTEESLKKLCQVVKETEKELIDNNMIDKRFLTPDRTFVLFDPEPYLDDSHQIKKYSTQELFEIVTKYDGDSEKYEAAKNVLSKKCIEQNHCEKEISDSNDENCLENNLSNHSHSTKHEITSSPNADQQSQCQNVSQNIYEEKKDLSHKICLEKNVSNKSKSINDSQIETDKQCLEKEFLNKSKSIEDSEIETNEQFLEEEFTDKRKSVDDSEIETDEQCLEKEFSNKPKSVDDSEIETNEQCLDKECLNISNNVNNTEEIKTGQRLRFTNVYDLFQIPDFSLLMPSKYVDTNVSFTNEQYTDKDLIDQSVSNMSSVKYLQQMENMECDVEIDDEEYSFDDDNNESWSDEVEFEENSDEDFIENESVDFCSENESSYNDDDKNRNCSVKYNIKSERNSACGNIQNNNIDSQRMDKEIRNNSQQFVDYEVLNHWYGEWKQQLNVIQTCIRMSK